jgi:rifampicin phosphotransferase
VGGKAVGLGRLLSGGFPVPDGFAVTTDAYRDVLNESDLAAQIDGHLEAFDESADNSAIAENIRQLFGKRELPDAISADLAAAYQELSGGADVPVAVRSSATAEDTDAASFAGQQDTYLWICGVDAVIEHVVRCWASLFTSRAIGYRARFDVDATDLAMGVVVQRMVPADAAGVMMSLHPVTGDLSEIYIESAVGLGEAIVRGDVDPDRIVLDQKSLRPLHIEIGTKEFAHRFEPGVGGIRVAETSAEERQELSLSDRAINELGKLCRDVETNFGGPVDIEWAVADDTVYLLQARPETVWSHKYDSASHAEARELSDPLSGPADSECYWTTVNAGEAIQGIPTPLTYSWYHVAGELGLRHCFADLGVLSRGDIVLPESADERFVSIFLGRVVLNVDVWRHAGDLLPGSSGNAIEEQFFGAVRPGLESHSTIRRYPFVAVKFPLSLYLKQKRINQIRRDYEIWWRESLRRLEGGNVAVAEDLLTEAFNRFNNVMRHHVAGSMLSQALYERLAGLCKSVGKQGLEHALTTGYGSMEESAVLEELWRRARANEDLAPLTQRYGYYGSNSGELSAACWREDPRQVASLAERYRALDADRGPDKLAKRQHNKRLAAEAELLAALSPPLKPAARAMMKLASMYLPLRETGRAALLMATDVGRASARVIGEDLCARGVLNQPDDIMFHTHDEVHQGRFSPAQVAHRRKRRDRYARLELPEAWQGAPTPVAATAFEEGTVSGLPANDGVVEGTVRVVLDSGDAFQPGEILVCRTTDPTWASLMLLASAVVVDIGGALSHGAIVARELGIPCIVNTKTGTKRLVTGDVVRVDGRFGTVERVSEPQPAETSCTPK